MHVYLIFMMIYTAVQINADIAQTNTDKMSDNTLRSKVRDEYSE